MLLETFYHLTIEPDRGQDDALAIRWWLAILAQEVAQSKLFAAGIIMLPVKWQVPRFKTRASSADRQLLLLPPVVPKIARRD